MYKSIWGPFLWYIIHNIAYNSNLKYKNIYYYFYNRIIPELIPCLTCRYNYNKHLKQLPLHFNNKTELFLWTVKLHNIVNLSLKKTIYLGDLNLYSEININKYIWYCKYLINQTRLKIINIKYLNEFISLLKILLPQNNKNKTFISILIKFYENIINIKNLKQNKTK